MYYIKMKKMPDMVMSDERVGSWMLGEVADPGGDDRVSYGLGSCKKFSVHV
jgi:hypothetical protein